MKSTVGGQNFHKQVLNPFVFVQEASLRSDFVFIMSLK